MECYRSKQTNRPFFCSRRTNSFQPGNQTKLPVCPATLVVTATLAICPVWTAVEIMSSVYTGYYGVPCRAITAGVAYSLRDALCYQV